MYWFAFLSGQLLISVKLAASLLLRNLQLLFEEHHWEEACSKGVPVNESDLCFCLGWLAAHFIRATLAGYTVLGRLGNSS